MTNTKAGQSISIPDAETLEKDPRYRLILELDFSEMIPFVLSNIRKRGMIPLFFLGINLIFLFFIVLYSVWSIRTSQMNGGKIFWQLLAGIFAGSILVIAPHELLHGLAYRMLGARNIQFGADLE